MKDLSFSFRSYIPEWMYKQFEYQVVDQSILEEKDFKDRDWFEATDYEEIIKTFWGDDKVIYLLDERYIKDGKAYLVRVYFNYPAEE
ncbi:MAG: hypothetical protein ACOCWM_00815 [Cyclobacteriaceae bacterium]